jgi:hypothetical protein
MSLSEVDCLLRQAQWEVERTHTSLLRGAKYLAERLTRLVEQLESEGLDANVNALGEVQSSGFDVDRLCVQFRGARATRDALRRAVEMTRQER